MATLSDHYARGRASSPDDAIVHAAYLGARFPATYAAVSATLGMLPRPLLDAVRSALDLGAGPGTASWAVAQACPHLETLTHVDRSAALLTLGARLAAAAGVVPPVYLVQVQGEVSNPQHAERWSEADLVVASYVLAELSAPQQAVLVDRACRAARHLLVLVEPGTPAGFAHIHAARARCLASGLRVLAPCSHDAACPMHATGDWCHFAVRVPRSRRHRRLKGGTLGYEDEKFACLVVATREAADLGVGARVLRHPRLESGFVGLELCTPDRPTRVSVTRRDPSYRRARKTEWGGTWPAAPDGDP